VFSRESSRCPINVVARDAEALRRFKQSIEDGARNRFPAEPRNRDLDNIRKVFVSQVKERRVSLTVLARPSKVRVLLFFTLLVRGRCGFSVPAPFANAEATSSRAAVNDRYAALSEMSTLHATREAIDGFEIRRFLLIHTEMRLNGSSA
jgi:hypothetical protein